MIPAPRGLVARYKSTVEKEVLAFDDDGSPQVMSDRGYLVAADRLPGFAGVGADPLRPIVSIIPAGGWRVAYDLDDGSTFSQPLAAWGLRADGEVVPLDTDSTGYVESMNEVGGKWRLYHPDAEPVHDDTAKGSAS